MEGALVGNAGANASHALHPENNVTGMEFDDYGLVPVQRGRLTNDGTFEVDFGHDISPDNNGIGTVHAMYFRGLY